MSNRKILIMTWLMITSGYSEKDAGAALHNPNMHGKVEVEVGICIYIVVLYEPVYGFEGLSREPSLPTNGSQVEK